MLHVINTRLIVFPVLPLETLEAIRRPCCTVNIVIGAPGGRSGRPRRPRTGRARTGCMAYHNNDNNNIINNNHINNNINNNNNNDNNHI